MVACRQLLTDACPAGRADAARGVPPHRRKKSWIAARSRVLAAPWRCENTGVESAQSKEESPMNTDFYMNVASVAERVAEPTAQLDRLGDEIAELSAHLDA